MKPIIGITPDYDPGEGGGDPKYFLREPYITAIEQAGGIPLILPYVDGGQEIALLLKRIHGLLLTGGAFDIDPSYYGESWTVKEGTVKENRTHFEMEITRQALAIDLPILGICGGEQNLNVVLKGSLLQDIKSQKPEAMNHEQKKMKTEPDHLVEILKGTLLHQVVGAGSLQVNSTHHQAVKAPGEGVQVNALAPDGVVEGIESTRHRFVLGVQWHPESLIHHNQGCRRIFEALTKEAGIVS